MKNFFTYDPEEGIEYYETAKEAEQAAKDIIDLYRDSCTYYDPWPEWILDIYWGQILGRSVETRYELATGRKDEYTADYDIKPCQEME